MTASKGRAKGTNRLPLLAQAGPVSLWMILFVTIPMLFIIFISFMTRGTFGGVEYTPSLGSYQTMMEVTYFHIIVKSLGVAAETTIACLIVGYPFAYYIARKPPATASRLITLLMIPFWTNSLMRLNAWMLIFQTNGPVNNFMLNTHMIDKPITFIFTDGLVLLGLITNYLPFAVLPMYSSIEKLQKPILEASADLGAKPSVTLLKVTLPLTFPGIFSAIILTFIPALGPYVITDMLGGGKVLYIGNIIKNQFGTIRDIACAELILCGGYGLGNEETWHKLEALADKLNGAAACTRAALDAGWGCTEDTMIGTSGRAVSPEVYVGFGISGAAHHTCGIAGAGRIISINTDKDAEAFAASDYKGVFDAEQVIDALLDQIQ